MNDPRELNTAMRQLAMDAAGQFGEWVKVYVSYSVTPPDSSHSISYPWHAEMRWEHHQHQHVLKARQLASTPKGAIANLEQDYIEYVEANKCNSGS